MLVFLYAFLLGTLSILSPCSFIIIPVLTSEVDTKIQRILKFMFGIIIIFTILGILSAITGKLLTNFMGPYLYIFAAVVTLIVGLNTLNFIKLKIPNLFLRHEITNPFLMVLLFGGVALGCVGPLIGSVLALIIAKASIFYGFFTMLFFSLGFATPFILFGIIITDKNLAKKIMKHSLKIRRLGGILLILVSIFLFYTALRGLI